MSRKLLTRSALASVATVALLGLGAAPALAAWNDDVGSTAESGQTALFSNIGLGLEAPAALYSLDNYPGTDKGLLGIDTTNTSSGVSKDIVFAYENTNNADVLVEWNATALTNQNGHLADCLGTNSGAPPFNCQLVNLNALDIDRVDEDATLANLVAHGEQGQLGSVPGSDATVDGAGSGFGTYATADTTVYDPGSDQSEGFMAGAVVIDTDVIQLTAPYDLQANTQYISIIRPRSLDWAATGP